MKDEESKSIPQWVEDLPKSAGICSQCDKPCVGLAVRALDGTYVCGACWDKIGRSNVIRNPLFGKRVTQDLPGQKTIQWEGEQ